MCCTRSSRCPTLQVRIQSSRTIMWSGAQIFGVSKRRCRPRMRMNVGRQRLNWPHPNAREFYSRPSSMATTTRRRLEPCGHHSLSGAWCTDTPRGRSANDRDLKFHSGPISRQHICGAICRIQADLSSNAKDSSPIELV